MKRTIQLFILLLMCAALLACAAKEAETREMVAVSAPNEQDVTLTLPIGRRTDVTKLLKGYTDGFVSGSGKLLTFTAETENPEIALPSLFADGTLCILGVKEGKTTVTVTAISETGESATGKINVTVNSARRMAALILIGVIAVVLFILFGQPNKQKPAPQQAEEPNETPQAPAEEPKAEQNYMILPERSTKE